MKENSQPMAAWERGEDVGGAESAGMPANAGWYDRRLTVASLDTREHSYLLPANCR